MVRHYPKFISSAPFGIGFSILVLVLFVYAFSEQITGKVIKVQDGDTVEILYESKPVKIRLYGIDCPEKKQDFGTRAQQYTSTCCFGKNVKVIPHGKDKYRRILGEIILPDGQNLNQLLVKNGYAWRYKLSKDKVLGELQAEAQKNKRGLWAMPSPKPPWVFRSEKKKVKSIPEK